MALSNEPMTAQPLPGWAQWTASEPYSVGVEEEVMILEPRGWQLAQETESVLSGLSPWLADHAGAETHAAALELTTDPHTDVGLLAGQLSALRSALLTTLTQSGYRAAAAGTHPCAEWNETKVSSGARYQLVYESMRELARREPTFALHVHVGVEDPEDALRLYNSLRAHAPLLLALSSNSPFWQGRDAGLASTRTPIFQMFPRVGIPRAFRSYAEYVEAIDMMLRSDAFPEPTFLWWDVRLQPRFGTVELRTMDAQSTVARGAALAALVQAIAHLELEEGYHAGARMFAPEVLDENRFLAARDGMDARLIDPERECRVPASEQLMALADAVRPHAQQLGAESMLDCVLEMAAETGAARQRRVAERSGLRGVIECLAEDFAM